LPWQGTAFKKAIIMQEYPFLVWASFSLSAPGSRCNPVGVLEEHPVWSHPATVLNYPACTRFHLPKECSFRLVCVPSDTVKRKILVLDLDETLIHSHHDGVLRPTVRPGTPPDFILKVCTSPHDGNESSAF
jgi:hypothetical protein